MLLLLLLLFRLRLLLRRRGRRLQLLLLLLLMLLLVGRDPERDVLAVDEHVTGCAVGVHVVDGWPDRLVGVRALRRPRGATLVSYSVSCSFSYCFSFLTPRHPTFDR